MTKKILKYKLKNRLKNHQGFTLVELIIYLGIAAVVLISVVTTGWNIIINQAAGELERELYANARSVMHQIQYQIRGADDVITGSSIFNNHPGILTLDYPGNNDVIFSTYEKDVSIGGLDATITKLQIKIGQAEYVDLTSDKLTVSDFTLTNLTRNNEAKNININLTLETANPGNDPTYDHTISLETAVSIRR